MKYSPSIKAHIKKTRLEVGMENLEDRVRHNTGAEQPSGYHDDDNDDDDYRRRPSRGEREAQKRKNRFAADVIRTSPRMKKMKKRWTGINNAERKPGWQ
jgi:hypothetical protein